MTEGHRSAPGQPERLLSFAVVAQLVERVLGKDEVTSSILVNGSRVLQLGGLDGSRILKWFVYVLRSIPTGRHYIGMTSDVQRRLHEHNTKTGRWTSSFQPWKLVAIEPFQTRGEAAVRERFLKSRAGIGERQRLYEQSAREVLVERP